MENFKFKSIGVIHSSFKKLENMPIQPTGEKAMRGQIEIFPKYIDGLEDVDGFSHIIVIYHFHKCSKTKLTVKPFLDNYNRGVFSTRAPVRPNHIGISIVEVARIDKGIIHIKNIDALDGTPVLDIKPFVPNFDIPKTKIKLGWLDSVSENAVTKISDDRFK